MDSKQLLRDIISMNTRSLRLRWDKLSGLVSRKLSGQRISQVVIEEIPVIINNRNRLTYLLQLISWLENAGMKNIIILDNDSTFLPLLKYYDSTDHRVVRLRENVGHLALWKSYLFEEVRSKYYIYTDPDVVPAENCPYDAIGFLLKQLQQFPEIEKIGFGLKIDDLPDHYEGKQRVIDWEKRYWSKPVTDKIFDAEVDTTFALYRPFTDGSKWVARAYRTGQPYVARHLPWYENSANPGEENLFYANHVRQGASHWIQKK
jgi:hypothetical protein